jgi:hypothetical protein
VGERSGVDNLAATRQLAVVLRLVVTTSGNVLYGEVVDTVTGEARRFVGLPGLSGAVRSWLKGALRRPFQEDEASPASN